MSAPLIRHLRCRLLAPRLPRPWGAEAPRNYFIVTTVVLDDGQSGTGFSWTPSIGAGAVQSLLENDIRRHVIGRSAAPEPLWASTMGHLREAGTSGITSIAVAGLDLAVWDAQARRHGNSLSAELGQSHESLPVYGSGVNHHYSERELAAQVERWVTSGFRGAKIKVGLHDLATDIRRVRLVREILGPERTLMLDANQRWDVPGALRAIDRLSEFDLAWVEEPLPGDELRGYADLRSRVDVPIAAGENIHTARRFAEFMDAGALDVVQPNIIRVGGITPFLEIAALTRTRALQLAPHLLLDLSAQLSFALPIATWVEDVEDADFQTLGLLTGPSPVVRTADRVGLRADVQGLGLDFVQQLAATSASV